MKKKATPLTEEEKMNIYACWKVYGPRWEHISHLTDRKPTTCQSFISSYLKHGTIFPKRGPHFRITEEEKDSIISITLGNPCASLQDVSSDTNISTTYIKNVLNEEGIFYMKKIAVPPLTAAHMQKRYQFSMTYANLPYQMIPPIIFSDESMVGVDMNKGGIWRYRGSHPPEGFYEKTAHPIQVMVWGAIGPYGYRSPLLWVKVKMDAKKYISLLRDNNIINNINARFPSGFVWQQDNAPPHQATETILWLKQNVQKMLDWPAKSPDLNPIEQIWYYIKSKSKGLRFGSASELFDHLSNVWLNITNEVIHNYYSSFKARCMACAALGGKSLNGRWNIVREYHNQYRTILTQNGEVAIAPQ